MQLYNQIRKALSVHKRALKINSEIKSVSFKQLGFGENNTSIYVNVNNKHEFTFRVAMKRSRKRMLEKEKHMKSEFDVLGNLPKGIAPIPILFDNSKTIIPRAYCALSYVDGKIKKMWKDSEIKLHAQALSMLHAKKYKYLEEDGVRFKKLDFYSHYVNNWIPLFNPSLKDKQIALLLPEFIKYLKKNNQLFTSLRKFTRVHGDLANDNILFTDTRIMYIDWEWSKISDPARDVARVFNTSFNIKPWYVKFTKQQKRLLIKTYLGKRKDINFEKRVDVWNNVLFFSDYLYFKWKINNYGGQESGFSKKKYENAVKVMYMHLKKELNC